MNTANIRQAFLSYFESKGHTIVQSSSLIPAGDPTLLFTNAGMVQFKDCFLGTEKRLYTRATTCQKCLRISGKHNDLENVGRTARHHTFFEMLGNFSFGDYFKKDAISYAWEFVTKVLELSKDRLWVTIYEEDSEAQKLWLENTDIKKERVLKRGKKDNFWAMGETGPCGPCSEIFFFLGSDIDKQKAEELLDDNPLYVEIWNLVFMQFNRNPAGDYQPLPKPSVDTGMGLERVAAIKQGFSANYDSDILREIIKHVECISGHSYLGKDYTEKTVVEDMQYATDVAMRVIADHIRACCFLIADGISPSSEGRGYVLRRLIRRACRHGRVLGLSKPFLAQAAEKLIELMSNTYPELQKASLKIMSSLKNEEEKFLKTLDAGISILNKELSQLKEKGEHLFSGKIAFSLHDTYGFPLDMTEDILRTDNIQVDEAAFNAAMEEQKERSRSVRSSDTVQILQRSVRPMPSSFVGYDYDEYESQVIGIFDKDGEVKLAKADDEIAVITESTPFYAESGGQIGDTGRISSNDCTCEVLDTQKIGSNTIVHMCKVLEGSISYSDRVRLCIDKSRRQKIRCNHSAAHLLHLALREVLGEKATQAGSRVSEHSLRFDFYHSAQTSKDQLASIEQLVNRYIQENAEITTEILSLQDAQKSGAMALFDEKYEEKVRVVQIGELSRELCGGTHAKRSGDLGALVLLSESSVAAGIRRIEAYSGFGAYQKISKDRELLGKLISMLNTNESGIIERAARIIERNKEIERELESLKSKSVASGVSQLISSAKELSDGTKIITGFLKNTNPKQLREIADNLRAQVSSACIALAGISNDKPLLLTAVSKNLIKDYHAGELLKKISIVSGSIGGGKADLAQAGGGDINKLQDALVHFKELF